MYRDVVQLKQSSILKRGTFLGVGPVSLNCIDASIALANEYRIPLILIASRRQIDSEQFGGGYVNNWTTQDFCRYVNQHDTHGVVQLARDHGGPWQNDLEVKQQMHLSAAMRSAKDSYQADIEAGMTIIHIDPGRSHTGEAITQIPDFIERTKELLLFCYQAAAEAGKHIAIEVGTDEGIVGSASVEETEAMLVTLLDFCKAEKLPPPSFMVVQTGTKVMEMRNIGILDNIIRHHDNAQHLSDLSKLIALCDRHNVLLKEHNADYLSDEALAWHPTIGVDSANIAPEFGIIETKAFLKFLQDHQLHDLHEQTIELAYRSGKWKKWMLPNTVATDYERAVIAGHYVFSTPEFHHIKAQAQLVADRHHIQIDTLLRDAVKAGLYRCLSNFGWMTPGARSSSLSQDIVAAGEPVS